MRIIERECVGLQVVSWCRANPTGNALVSEVGHSFSRAAENRWTVDPPHGQDHRKGNERAAARVRRKDDTETNCMCRIQVNAIEAIRHIDLDYERGAMSRVGFAQLV